MKWQALTLLKTLNSLISFGSTNGVFPTNIRYIMHPSAHKSAAAEHISPSSSSGETYLVKKLKQTF